MPDWLAPLLVPICREGGRSGEASTSCPEPEGAQGWTGSGSQGQPPPPTEAGQPTWSPMTHWPALMVASSKLRSCFSEYLTPMSTPLWSPFVLAWKGGVLGGSQRGHRDPRARPRPTRPWGSGSNPPLPPGDSSAQSGSSGGPSSPATLGRLPSPPATRASRNPPARPHLPLPPPLPGLPAPFPAWRPQGAQEMPLGSQFPPPEMLFQPSLVTRPHTWVQGPLLQAASHSLELFYHLQESEDRTLVSTQASGGGCVSAAARGFPHTGRSGTGGCSRGGCPVRP